MAADLADRGDEALRHGHLATASWAFLAAAEYYAKALVFVDAPFDLFTEVRKYQARDFAGQITTPLLILDPDDEQFFPGQSRQLYDLLPGQKAIIGFTQAQGANFHCQPTGRQLSHTQMLDWLADHLPPRQA